jgi:hypothetical protein
VTIKLTAQMVINDEKKDIICPLLTRPTHIDNKISPSNHGETVLPIKNSEMNGTHVIPLNESITISFENINYILGQTENIKFYQKWKKIFSYCKQTPNKQILFDLSGVFPPGMNAILGMYHHY